MNDARTSEIRLYAVEVFDGICKVTFDKVEAYTAADALTQVQHRTEPHRILSIAPWNEEKHGR